MKKRTRRTLLKIFFIFIILSAVGTSGFIVYKKTLNKSLSGWNDKIYYGVSIGGIDVGGKTEEEATLAVKSQLVNTLQNKNVKISINDSNFYFAYKDFNLDYGVEDAVQNAIKYGKSYSAEEKVKLINRNSEIDHNIDLNITADEDKLNEKYEYIKEKEEEEPQNAKIEIKDDKVNIIKEIVGVSIDSDEFKNKVSSSFDDTLDPVTELNITPENKNPDILSSNLAGVKDKISNYSTDYSKADDNTAYNIELSASHIDGKLLMPGEEFSFNDIASNNTEYKEGAIKLGDENLKSYAEGISQVCTTLYRSVMQSGLKSIERHKNNVVTSYSEPGLEACAIFGSDDYKFKNTYNFPIYIEAKTYNKTININVFGDKAGLDGKTYDIISETVSREEPAVTYKDAPDLPIGSQVIEYAGSPKCTINSYRITVQNKNVINKELISTDTYESINSIVKKGTNISAQSSTGDIQNGSPASAQTK